MGQVEQIGNSPEERDDNTEVQINTNAGRPADRLEIEVERVEEERHEACHEEDAVPLQDDVAPGVEDPARLPWLAACE